MIKTDNPGVLSNLSASISHLVVAAALLSGDAEMRNNPQLRRDIERKVHDILEDAKPDYNDWPYVKDCYEFYDQYIQARRQSGELTEFDLVRPNLNKVNFSSESEYWDHLQRFSEHRKAASENEGVEMKVCNKCGNAKPKYNFRATGATCNSCRARLYRERKGKNDD